MLRLLISGMLGARLLGAAALVGVGVASVASAQNYVPTAFDPLTGTCPNPPCQPTILSQANGINDRGDIVGWSNLGTYGGEHATIWNGTTPTDLGTLGGFDQSIPSVATSINNRGDVVGWSGTATSNDPQATIWNGGGTPIALGTLPGGPRCQELQAKPRASTTME
jgi:probable HAF family extracellular repeat protein